VRVASRKREVILETLKDALKRIPRERSCGCGLKKGAEFKF